MKKKYFFRFMSLIMVLLLVLGGCSASKNEEEPYDNTEKYKDIPKDAENVIRVGPDWEFTSIQAAWDAAQPGSLIVIDGSATYFDLDASLIASGKDNITIRGINGRPRMEVPEGEVYLVQRKGIWVINSNNITIENIEFTGARNFESKNGSGVRVEPVVNITIRDCYFHHNDNGILTSAQADSTVTIEGCEFAYNGYGDGYSHNLYIGEVGTLVFRHNYSHHVKEGHLLKTRALNNYIEYNRLTDEDVKDGYSSGAAIDMPQGGNNYIIGNIMHQGNDNNCRFVWYGLEEKVNPGKNLYFINNTLVNDHQNMREEGFITVRDDPDLNIVVINNIFTGDGRIVVDKTGRDLDGLFVDKSNIKNEDPGFVNRAAFDFRLTKDAEKAIDKGTDPGKSHDGYDLAPVKEYRHKCGWAERKVRGKAIDIGAYEY